MKKLLVWALVAVVVLFGSAAFANEACGAGKEKAAKAGKHIGLDKQLTDLQAQKDALLKKDANADTKELDAKIEKLKAKIEKKKSKKAEAAAPAAQ